MVKRGKHVAQASAPKRQTSLAPGRSPSERATPPSTKDVGKKAKITTKQIPMEEDGAGDKVTYKDVGTGLLILGLILLLIVIMFSAFNPLVATSADWGMGDVRPGAILFGVVGLSLMMIGGIVLLYPRWSRKL